MGKAVPMSSFRRAARPTDSAVAAFVGLGDAPGDTPVEAVPDPSNELDSLRLVPPALASPTVAPSPTSASGPPIAPVLQPPPALDAHTHTALEAAKSPHVTRINAPKQWRRKVLVRADGRELRKQTIYLDAELSHSLMIACAEKEYDLSEAIEEAVAHWLASKRPKAKSE